MILLASGDSLLVPISALSPIEGPMEFTRPPKPHQEEFVRINESKQSLILAAVQGLGKTFATLFRIKNLGVKSFIIVGINAVDVGWRHCH